MLVRLGEGGKARRRESGTMARPRRALGPALVLGAAAGAMEAAGATMAAGPWPIVERAGPAWAVAAKVVRVVAVSAELAVGMRVEVAAGITAAAVAQLDYHTCSRDNRNHSSSQSSSEASSRAELRWRLQGQVLVH